MGRVKEEIKSICVNYMAFTVECAMNPRLKQAFQANPKPYLNDQVGMKIPYDDNVMVVLDDARWRWPIMLVKAKTASGQECFVLEEGKLECSVQGEQYYREIEAYLKEQEQLDAAPDLLLAEQKIYIKNPQDFEQTHKYEHSEKITTVIQDMAVNDIVIILPFLDVDTDMLGVIEYNEDSEIVLTTSC
jgi:hypothetical protein